MTPDRGRQMAVDARYKVRVMEGVLEKSVQQAALRLNEQLRRVSPDLIQLTGAAHARGYRLEGYGLFFDVEVPAAMRQTHGLDGAGDAPAAARRRPRRSARSSGSPASSIPKARAEAERAMHQIELVVRPMPQGARSSDRRVRRVGVRGRSGHVDRAGADRHRRRTPNRRRRAPPDADALIWRSPDLAYEEQVREALIGAMLDWGALLPLAPDEWLTVAARDNQDVIMPGAAPDVVTIILRVKGSDLADRLAGRIATEDLRRRVDVREF